jgi:hypothetical protein
VSLDQLALMERQVLLVRLELRGRREQLAQQAQRALLVQREQLDQSARRVRLALLVQLVRLGQQELLARLVFPGSMLTRQQRSSANQQLAPTSLFRYPADIGSRWGNMSSSPPGATIKSQAAAPQLSIWITSATAATFLLVQLSQRPRYLLVE